MKKDRFENLLRELRRYWFKNEKVLLYDARNNILYDSDEIINISENGKKFLQITFLGPKNIL
jgi:hypothetical protein